MLKNEEQRRQERREKRGVTTHRQHRIVRVCVCVYVQDAFLFCVGGGLLLGSFWKKKRLLFLCVVFCLGFYKKIQNPKHIGVEEGLSFIFFLFVFFSPFVFSFLVGLCIEYVRSTRAL